MLNLFNLVSETEILKNVRLYMQVLPLYYFSIVVRNVLDCKEALGMESGLISSGQLSASSQHNSHSAANSGRLHKTTAVGGWVTATDDGNQWLQVDLDNQFTTVTRVATQGRSDLNQWVLSYNLEYRDDGGSYEYYIEKGQLAKKVKLDFKWGPVEKRREWATLEKIKTNCIRENLQNISQSFKLVSFVMLGNHRSACFLCDSDFANKRLSCSRLSIRSSSEN